jgi:hypothetical protein
MLSFCGTAGHALVTLLLGVIEWCSPTYWFPVMR